MGFEFKIILPSLNADRAGEVLRSAPFYSDYDARYEFFSFRDPDQQSFGWPMLWAKIEPDGIYLCHNGDRVVFHTVVEYIRQNLSPETDEPCLDEL